MDNCHIVSLLYRCYVPTIEVAPNNLTIRRGGQLDNFTL